MSDLEGRAKEVCGHKHIGLPKEKKQNRTFQGAIFKNFLPEIKPFLYLQS